MDNSAVLTWEYPDVPGLQGFDIWMDEDPAAPGQFDTPTVGTPPEARSYTFTGLAPGTFYFIIRARVSNRPSGFSNQVSKTVEIPVPVLSVS